MPKILFLVDHKDYTTMSEGSITLNHINIFNKEVLQKTSILRKWVEKHIDSLIEYAPKNLESLYYYLDDLLIEEIERNDTNIKQILISMKGTELRRRKLKSRSKSKKPRHSSVKSRSIKYMRPLISMKAGGFLEQLVVGTYILYQNCVNNGGVPSSIAYIETQELVGGMMRRRTNPDSSSEEWQGSWTIGPITERQSDLDLLGVETAPPSVAEVPSYADILRKPKPMRLIRAESLASRKKGELDTRRLIWKIVFSDNQHYIIKISKAPENLTQRELHRGRVDYTILGNYLYEAKIYDILNNYVRGTSYEDNVVKIFDYGIHTSEIGKVKESFNITINKRTYDLNRRGILYTHRDTHSIQTDQLLWNILKGRTTDHFHFKHHRYSRDYCYIITEAAQNFDTWHNVSKEVIRDPHYNHINPLTDYYAQVLRIKNELFRLYKFSHWDMHTNNVLFNPLTKKVKFFDFDQSIIDTPSGPTISSAIRMYRYIINASERIPGLVRRQIPFYLGHMLDLFRVFFEEGLTLLKYRLKGVFTQVELEDLLFITLGCPKGLPNNRKLQHFAVELGRIYKDGVINNYETLKRRLKRIKRHGHFIWMVVYSIELFYPCLEKWIMDDRIRILSLRPKKSHIKLKRMTIKPRRTRQQMTRRLPPSRLRHIQTAT